MNEKFEQWKKDLQSRASEVIEAPEEEVDRVLHDAAVHMRDVAYFEAGNRPIDKIIPEFEAIGWRYRGPMSADELYQAIAQDKKEITVITAGDQRYIFEREKGTR